MPHIAAMDVPVQYFQSVITIELAVAGALLWQIHYFDSKSRTDPTRLISPTPACASAWVWS
jgi:hypothetical protein